MKVRHGIFSIVNHRSWVARETQFSRVPKQRSVPKIISCSPRAPQVLMYERSEPCSTQLSPHGYSSSILPLRSPLPFPCTRLHTETRYRRGISLTVKVSLRSKLWTGNSICPALNWSAIWKDHGTLSPKDDAGWCRRLSLGLGLDTNPSRAVLFPMNRQDRH